MSATAIVAVSRVMLTRGFAELTIEVRDLAALERFYTRVFGLDVLAREDDRVWLAAGERARLGLWLPGEKEFGDEGGRHVHFAFSAGPPAGGDRTLTGADAAGTVVGVWDFFARGAGRRDGAAALVGGDVQQVDPSS